MSDMDQWASTPDDPGLPAPAATRPSSPTEPNERSEAGAQPAEDLVDKELFVDAEADDDEQHRALAEVTAWVEGWLAYTVRRAAVTDTSVRWCASWWAHPEAVSRLGALYAAWRTARAEGGPAMSDWWLSHFDPHWEALTSTTGPFAGCKTNRHTRSAGPLATTHPEPGDQP